jgi:hypothetical protein
MTGKPNRDGYRSVAPYLEVVDSVYERALAARPTSGLSFRRPGHRSRGGGL